MKVTILAILFVVLKTVDSVPVESGTGDIQNYVPAERVVEEITQGPTLNRKKESDLEPAEYHHPLLVVKYPVYGGYHGYHGYHGHHGYYRPHWHPWHGHEWGPYYGRHWASHGGYHGPGFGVPWVY